MSSINIKRGVQFQPDLFRKSDRTAWLDAVGAELEKKGVTVKVGEGWQAKEVRNAAELKEAVAALAKAAATPPTTPPPAGAPNPAFAAKSYVSDLMQALDDIVSPEAKVAKGDRFDFSKGSKLSKALGVDDGKMANYGSSVTTDFGIAAKKKPEATMVVDGVTLQARAPTGLDLSTVPHMSAETMRNAPATYGRDGEEVEATRVITGLSKAQVVSLATDALNDLQRPKSAVGLTVGQIPLDEMTWDSDSHALRRANPYVSFSLDYRSLEVSPNSGQPRVAVGRDFFFDAVMAKKDLETGKLTKELAQAGISERDRIRYGSDQTETDGTRQLVGAKFGTHIDEDGNKHAQKVDSRSDSVTHEMIEHVGEVAATGRLGPGWPNQGKMAPAAVAVHRAAVQAGLTQNVGGETDVLALEVGAVVRQIRGRFHLNETSQSNLLKGFNEAGEPKLTQLQALIQAAPDFAASGDQPSKAQLLTQVGALLDRSAIVKAATAGLKAVDPNVTVDKALIDRLWPGKPVTTKADVKLQRAVADAIRTTYDAFSQSIDDLQRNIGGTTDKAVRDAGSANDVRDFFRQKAAVASFMARAEANAATSGVTVGNPASYTAYAKKIVAMADGKEKTDLLQSIGVGMNQLKAMDDAAFASPVKVTAGLLKKQTFEPFLTELDAQRAGPNAAAFATELGTYLAGKKSPALDAAADKAPVLDNLRKNLVTAHVEVLHRMIEGAACWGQGIWFDNYRQTMLGISPNTGNFIIGSMDYAEFYDAKTGLGLSFKERVSRAPLDAVRMKGAQISNDIQIELESEDKYNEAIRTAQYGINGATAGLAMDYALSKKVAGLTAGDAPAFEKWFAAQAALPDAQRKAFVADLATYAQSKGSPIDVKKTFESLVTQEKAIRMLTGFAATKNPALNVNDRAAVEAWYRTQAALPEEQVNDFLTEVAGYARTQKLEVPLSPNLLATLDFKPFVATNVGQPATGHAALVENLTVAEEIWSMVKKAGQDLSDARGLEVKKVLDDNGMSKMGWEPPALSKEDTSIELALS